MKVNQHSDGVVLRGDSRPTARPPPFPRCRNARQTMPITYNLRGLLTSSDRETERKRERERERENRELNRSVSVQRYFPAIRNASPSRHTIFARVPPMKIETERAR